MPIQGQRIPKNEEPREEEQQHALVDEDFSSDVLIEEYENMSKRYTKEEWKAQEERARKLIDDIFNRK